MLKFTIVENKEFRAEIKKLVADNIKSLVRTEVTEQIRDFAAEKINKMITPESVERIVKEAARGQYWNTENIQARVRAEVKKQFPKNK